MTTRSLQIRQFKIRQHARHSDSSVIIGRRKAGSHSMSFGGKGGGCIAFGWEELGQLWRVASNGGRRRKRSLDFPTRNCKDSAAVTQTEWPSHAPALPRLQEDGTTYAGQGRGGGVRLDS